MIRHVRCECGYIARGRTDDDVIVIILAHLARDHRVDSVSAQGVTGR
jgi:hypothetical protein